MKNLDINPEHLKIIKTILQKHLPTNAIVWVFGSRAQRAKKKYSDLDLLIAINNYPLPSATMIDLAEDFDESDLPYKVDLVDWNSISESFRSHIQKNRIVLDWKNE